MPEPYSPVEAAIALALYGHNVSPYQRAVAIYEHFGGECAELADLVEYMVRYGSAPTSLAFPSAEIYVQQALDRYGAEARERVRVERGARA